MRKIFRMHYEPCQGLCYSWEDVVDVSELASDPERYARLKASMIQIHEPSCGDDQIRYAIDLDEDNALFVASFMHYGKLELLSGKNLVDLLEEFCVMVTAYWESDVGVLELEAGNGVGHDVCEHGKDHQLDAFMDKFSGAVSV